MAWAKQKSTLVELTAEQLAKRESYWVSAYPGIEGWSSLLRDSHYDLVGEYLLDENRTLFRFELSADFAGEYAYRFINVEISRKSKVPVLATVIDTEKCPTCSKPI